MTNIEQIGKMKYPDDQFKQMQLAQTMNVALDEEEQRYVHLRKTVKRRETMKKMGLTQKQIKAVEMQDDFNYKLFNTKYSK